MIRIWFILNIDMFISKNDDKEHHKELFQQFRADVRSYGINEDLRDEILKSVSKIQSEIVIEKLKRNNGE